MSWWKKTDDYRDAHHGLDAREALAKNLPKPSDRERQILLRRTISRGNDRKN